MNKIIIANWKLNGNIKFIKKYINKIKKYINNNKYKICIAPPIIYLSYFYKLIKKNININLVSQNIDIHEKGAYTGETSVKMLKDLNIKYVLIGHSEIRKYHKENNKNILKKFLITKKKNIIPILCIGENIDQYNKKKSINTCIKQINFIIKKKYINILKNTIIAYEPIWSIGTGKTANINHINKINYSIKKYIYSINKNIYKYIKIIYGGSINYKNYKKIIFQKNIDGLLIGNSSLNIKEFIKIIKN